MVLMEVCINFKLNLCFGEIKQMQRPYFGSRQVREGSKIQYFSKTQVKQLALKKTVENTKCSLLSLKLCLVIRMLCQFQFLKVYPIPF